jgi:hypothetical protein
MVSWRQRADDEQIVASFLQSVRASRARTPGTFRAEVSAIGVDRTNRILSRCAI